MIKQLIRKSSLGNKTGKFPRNYYGLLISWFPQSMIYFQKISKIFDLRPLSHLPKLNLPYKNNDESNDWNVYVKYGGTGQILYFVEGGLDTRKNKIKIGASIFCFESFLNEMRMWTRAQLAHSIHSTYCADYFTSALLLLFYLLLYWLLFWNFQCSTFVCVCIHAHYSSGMVKMLINLAYRQFFGQTTSSLDLMC